MKELRSRKMIGLLKKAVRLAKRKRLPRDGMILPLFTEEAGNGWYYQADLINDGRFSGKPEVKVFAFKPPHWYCGFANFFISQELDD